MDDLERIKRAAFTSIGRAFLFFLLAVGTVMAGLITWPFLAFKSGAILITMLAAILTLRVGLADRHDFRRTETWILMDKRHGLPAHRAQGVFANILKDTYRRFAIFSAALACACWVLAFAFRLAMPQAMPRMLV
ncbi:MAG: hypothetical protein ACKOEE_13725 [Tagaea sp.]